MFNFDKFFNEMFNRIWIPQHTFAIIHGGDYYGTVVFLLPELLAFIAFIALLVVYSQKAKAPVSKHLTTAIYYSVRLSLFVNLIITSSQTFVFYNLTRHGVKLSYLAMPSESFLNHAFVSAVGVYCAKFIFTLLAFAVFHVGLPKAGTNRHAKYPQDPFAPFTFTFTFYVLYITSLLLFHANDLLLIVLLIELQTLATVIYIVVDKQTGSTGEAAMKYVVCALVFGALLLISTLIVWSQYGSTNLSAIQEAINGVYGQFEYSEYHARYIGPGSQYMSLKEGFLGLRNAAHELPLSLLFLGLIFKLGAPPFQTWVIDSYGGAPIRASFLMAILPKLPLFFILHKVIGAGDVFTGIAGPYGYIYKFLICITFLCYWISIAALYIGHDCDSSIKEYLIATSFMHIGLSLIGFIELLRKEAMDAGPDFVVFIYIIPYLFISVATWGWLFNANALYEEFRSTDKTAFTHRADEEQSQRLFALATNRLNGRLSNTAFFGPVFSLFIGMSSGLPPIVTSMLKPYAIIAAVHIGEWGVGFVKVGVVLLIVTILSTVLASMYLTLGSTAFFNSEMDLAHQSRLRFPTLLDIRKEKDSYDPVGLRSISYGVFLAAFLCIIVLIFPDSLFTACKLMGHAALNHPNYTLVLPV